MQKIRGGKPAGVIIHISMELSQGNSLCYLKQKCHVFHFILSFYSSTKSENRRAEQALPRGRAGTRGRGKVLGNGSRKVNTV
jgi:hypothetical protein